MSRTTIAERARALDWDRLARQIDRHDHALTQPLGGAHFLRAQECRALIGLFDDDRRYRSTIDMRRVQFGSGVYRYFARPLPAIVEELRTNLYPPLASLASTWAGRLGENTRYPDTLEQYLAHCHAHGQHKPTPLIFRYREGDYNAFHQDLYGELGFPFQVLVVLSPDDEYTGGEFMLYKLRPRAQSTGQVVRPRRGQLLIFPNRYKPEARSQGGYYRAQIRHGVSRLHRGQRFSLGIIFHDAAK